MTERFANNAASTLNGAINGSTTTIVVTSATPFPNAGNFRLLLGSNPNTAEIVLVTGVSGTTFTVVRGQEFTSAQSWPDLTPVTQILTAGALTQAITGGGDLANTVENASVIKLRGNTVASQSLGAGQDGYLLTWSNTDGYWAAKPTTNTYFYAQPHDTTFNPIALYQFNGNLNDSSGNSRTLTLSAGTALYTDVAPQLKGFFFNGATKLTQTNSAFQIAGDITFECIMSLHNTNNGGILIASGDSGETQTTNYLYQLNFGGGGPTGQLLSLFWEFGAGNNVTYTFSDAPFNINEPFHFALVRQSAVLTMYINGRQVGASSGSLTPPDGAPGTQTLAIGADISNTAFLIGTVASLKVIGRALTQSEVASEFQRTLGNAFSGTISTSQTTTLSGNIVSPQSLGSSQDGYVLTWSNADGYWKGKVPTGGPFILSSNGADLNTTKTLSLDPAGTYAPNHGGSSLFIPNQLAIGQVNGLSTRGFGYVSAAAQTFTVPNGVYNIAVKMWGPGGGSGNYASSGGGGAGGYTTGAISVSPGDILYLAVGSGGKAPASSTANGGDGGWPGGGFGTRGDASGAGGGGLSGIFTSNTFSQAAALMIAGGGGGSTGFSNFGAGGGGGTTGGSGLGTSGRGGSQTAGGLNGNGTSSPSYTAGGALTGGTAYSDQTTSQTNDSGGGGSGYWGGGAGQGDGRAGGGGSGYLHPTRSTGVLTAGANAASGNVSNPPPNTTDIYYVAGVGVGALPGSNGGDGYIVLQWGTDAILNTTGFSFPNNTSISTVDSGNMYIQSGAITIATATANKFVTNSGRRIATNVKTASYTVTNTDEVIIVGSLSSTVTITLPALPSAGDTYIIKDQGGSANSFNIVISGNGNNIDGASTYTLNAKYESVTVVFANGSWSII